MLQTSSFSYFINIFRIIKGRPSKQVAGINYLAFETCRLDKVLRNSFVRMFGTCIIPVLLIANVILLPANIFVYYYYNVPKLKVRPL